MYPIITLFKNSQAQTMVVFYENQTYSQSIAKGAITYAKFNGILILETLVIPANPTQQDIDNMVQNISMINPDIVVGSGYYSICPMYFSSLQKYNWTPKGNALTQCTSNPQSIQLAPQGIFALDYVEWDIRLTGPDYVDSLYYIATAISSSTQLYFIQTLTQFGFLTTWESALVVGAGEVLHNILQSVNNASDTNSLLTAFSIYVQTSFVGAISFSTWGQNNARKVIVYQPNQYYELQIVYPGSSETEAFIYPIPQFDQRTFNYNYMGTPVELAFAALTTVAICSSIILIAWTFYHRKHPILHSSSPMFLMIILFGSILLYSSIFAWMLQAATASCYLRYWLLCLGFVLTFGSLFAKTWRIMVLFYTNSMSVFKISNSQLLIILGILIAIQVILLSIWSGLTHPYSTFQIVDQYYPSENFLICSSNSSSLVMMIIIVVYLGLLTLTGVYITIKNWNVSKLYNESRQISFAMYNMMSFGFLAFGLEVSDSLSLTPMFIIRSLCIIISTAITVFALFIPKINSIHRPVVQNSENSQTLSTSKTSFQNNPELEIANLKRKLKKAKKKIRLLEKHLNENEDEE